MDEALDASLKKFVACWACHALGCLGSDLDCQNCIQSKSAALALQPTMSDPKMGADIGMIQSSADLVITCPMCQT